MAELVFVYDRGVSIKSSDGSDSWVNLFARMRPDDSDDLAVCKRFRSEGAGWTLRVERG